MSNRHSHPRSHRPPLHPYLVHFPIGLWAGSFIADLAYLVTRDPILTYASFFAMGLGVILAVPTAIAGYFEFIRIPLHTTSKRLATVHFIVNIGLIFGYFFNSILRWVGIQQTPPGISWGSFIFSLVLMGFLGTSGWIGKLLVYRFGTGLRLNRAESLLQPVQISDAPDSTSSNTEKRNMLPNQEAPRPL